MKFKALLAPVAFAAFVTGSGVAVAGPTAYTSQASFLAAISNVGVDTFDDLDVTTYPSPLNRSAGAYSYTASVGPDSSDFFGAANENSLDIWLSSNVQTDTITFSNFTAGVRGVGGFFFGTDPEGFFTSAASITITATDASGISTQLLLNPSTSSFLGFVSTGALTSLTVAVTSGGSTQHVFPTINDLTLGTAVAAAVPEPETYALMLGGLGLLGWMARRRNV